MRNPLLDRSSPRELAERGQVIEKKEQLQVFARLTELLAADLSSLPEAQVPQKWRQTPVMIRLCFGWAESGRRLPVAEGRVLARIPAVCQRCLGPLELTLDVPLKLLLAEPDSDVGTLDDGGANDGSDDYEIWELDEETVRPLDILEEALIMGMPLAPMHESREVCNPPAEAESADSAETVRPFADLRAQLRQKDRQ